MHDLTVGPLGQTPAGGSPNTATDFPRCLGRQLQSSKVALQQDTELLFSVKGIYNLESQNDI